MTGPLVSYSQLAARRQRLPRLVLAGAALFVVLGLVGEALIFSNYVQVTRNVRPQFARATRLLPQLAGLRAAVLQLHAETILLMAADLPDYRAVEALRAEVEQRLNDLRRDAAAEGTYGPVLNQAASLLQVWDSQIAVLRSRPDTAQAAVMRFEIQRSFALAESALGDLAAVEEQEFYASTDRAFVVLGNIQGVLLGLGALLALTGALLFIILRRSARTEIERAYDRLQAAADVGRAAVSILDVDRLLGEVVNLIRDRFDVYHVSVFLLDERGERAVLREATGEAGRRLKAAGHTLAVGSQSIIGWVTENRRPRVAGEVGADPVHFKNELLPETRSELAVPLIAGDRLLGALDVQARAPNAFTEVDVRALQGLADQIAIAIANASEYSTQQVRSRKLAALSEAALQLAEPPPDLAGLLDLAARRAMAVVNADGAALWLPVADDEIELMVWYRGQVAQPAGRRLPRSAGPAADAWRAGRPVQAAAAADGLPGPGEAVATGLAVPMVWQGGVIGLLVLARYRPGAHFSAEDQDVARLFASQAAAALENFRLIAETRARVGELFALNQISTALTREMPADARRALRAAAEHVQTLFGADHVRVVLLDPEAAIAETAAEYPDWGAAGLRLPLAEYPLARQMMEERAAAWVDDAGQDPRLGEKARQEYLARGVQSLLIAPLVARDNVLGFLTLEKRARPRPLTDDEIALCLTVAAQLAIAVQNAGLYTENSRQARRERLINQITDRIRRAVDVSGVLATTAGELGAALGASRAHVEIDLPAAAGRAAAANGNGRELPQ